MIKSTDIAVIFVLYQPKQVDIEHISAIAQEFHGAIVDNTPVPCLDTPRIGLMHYIPLHENKGIAEAQNIGIERVTEQTAEPSPRMIVFMDQDSRCPASYFTAIAEEFERISKKQPTLALLGPTVVNQTTGETYHSVIHADNLSEDGFIPRRDVISSGACIPVEVLRKVGLNEASLFIDFVDFEWCWRAESQGYVCGITPHVTIQHKVGQRELSLLSYKVIISSPFRYYYQYRNHLRLCRRSYVPTQWKIATGIKHLARLFYLPLCIPHGTNYLKHMLRGLRDGVT